MGEIVQFTSKRRWSIQHQPRGKTVEQIVIGNSFLNGSPPAQQSSKRVDKWNCSKLKCFCTAKDTVTRLKKQSAEWEKIFASYMD
jgi:hypothetical protein